MNNANLEEIKDLECRLMDLEVDLKIVYDELDVVLLNLIYLSKKEKDLVYNINLHKNPNIITVIKEYKFSLEDLEHVKKQISKNTHRKKLIQSKLDKKLENYKYLKNKLEDKYQEVEDSKVILLFKKRS